jgi:hypothetical protein
LRSNLQSLVCPRSCHDLESKQCASKSGVKASPCRKGEYTFIEASRIKCKAKKQLQKHELVVVVVESRVVKLSMVFLGTFDDVVLVEASPAAIGVPR